MGGKQSKDSPEVSQTFKKSSSMDDLTDSDFGSLDSLSFSDSDIEIITKKKEFKVLLMIGVSGVGKSATANSILGRKAFESRGGSDSVTKEFSIAIGEHNGCDFKMVDLPGFGDTDTPDYIGQVNLVIDQLSKSLCHVRTGFDAVLLVYPYTLRLTKGEEKQFEFILSVLDKEGLKAKGILVITHGDTFRRENGDDAFEKWINGSDNRLKWLINLCGRRCVLFDNFPEEESVQENQVSELMRIVNTIKDKNKYIPRVCRNKEVNAAVNVQLVSYENVMQELAVLDAFLWGDGSETNIGDVREQGSYLYDIMTKAKIYKPDNDKMKQLVSLIESYDGRQDTKMKFRKEMIKKFQLSIEKKMKSTKFWAKFRTTIGSLWSVFKK